jgi:septal ring factor EnvC (AmiA/AmiB activator)
VNYASYIIDSVRRLAMRKGFFVSRVVGILIVAGVLLGGCASTKPFLGFLATTGYVDQKMQAQTAANQQSLDKIQSDLKSLQDDVNKFQDQTGQIKQITDEISKTRDQTQQLEKLASTVGDRIAGLPRETLLQLADMIQKDLAQTAAAGISSSAK